MSPAVANDKDSGHHKQHVHLQSLAASRPLTTANSYKDKEFSFPKLSLSASALDKIMPHRIKRVNSTHRIYGAATSASKSSTRSFVITEKAPTRAWLKAPTSAFTFIKTLC